MRGLVMKASNLALRPMQEEMGASLPQEPHAETTDPLAGAPTQRPAPRRPSLEFRVIVIRDQGLPQFRVR